jgi:hypothetical protein
MFMASPFPIVLRCDESVETQRAADERLSKHAGERDVGAQVTPPHPPRLLIDAIEPFEPNALHPRRRAVDVAGEHVDAAAHAHDERHVEAESVFVQEPLLLRRRHADEETVGLALSNGFDSGGLVSCALIPVAVAREVDARPAPQGLANRSIQDLRPGAEQVRAEALAGADRQ